MKVSKVHLRPVAKAYLAELKKEGKLDDGKFIVNFLNALTFPTSRWASYFDLILRTPDIFQAIIPSREFSKIEGSLLITASIDGDRLLIIEIKELPDILIT
ncbi:MAG: hypothetical protein A2508_00010 [Candidatus Lambdaproteobacteria bacterium RIFOXYD12_FULL_49_8]|uniref:Uncharacterized protein n=1 Tax=Candidatus Lambdaproteobacteria bacterium RIFOXYD2_FULL_50_16 TaxID=1817772 RepID=A0A1F6G9I1_9PROT|nr:MAG: hypothetical protein A2527_06135 [Candidatus Lambdaproteobacteria bacterium RIFOXYD2_FULL_50_16]OGG96777.1 MAG: hypothetical protein A2508_00010 [Candidatus Lambdaproteobacteria bacterium RIFOXYD12_FULL_49_8]